MITWLAANPESIATRLLSRRWLVTIGILSYSIYLWQQLFLALYAHLTVWNYAGLAVVSCGSYWLIERPFLRLRDIGKAEIRHAAGLVRAE